MTVEIRGLGDKYASISQSFTSPRHHEVEELRLLAFSQEFITDGAFAEVTSRVDFGKRKS